MTQNPQWKEAADVVCEGVTFETAARGLNGVRAAQHGAVRLQEVAHMWQNASPEQLAGRLAEELHAATFNADAAAKGLTVRAVTEAANGTHSAAADISIQNGGRAVGAAQVKYHGTAARTTFHVSDVKYDGMQRIVPSDQAARVREIAARRGVDGLGQRNFADVANSASDRVQSHGAQSSPLSRADALEAVRNPSIIAGELVSSRVVGAVKSGAMIGAAVGGGVSLIRNVAAYANDRKSGKDAIVDVAKDTAASAAAGAAVSGAAVATEVVLIRAGVGVLARGSAPVAIGLTVVDVGQDVIRFARGDIGGKKLAVNSGKSLVKGAATWGGMEAGAVLGSFVFPGVGTIVGGIVGGIVGAVGSTMFMSWLTD